MYILYFDISAIIILTIVLFANQMQGLNHGRTNSLYTWVVVFTLISAVADLLSGYGSNNFVASEKNKLLMNVFNYIYYLFHSNIVPVYFLYCFSSMGIWHVALKKKLNSILFYSFVVINNLLVLINPFTHVLFYIDENAKYCRGNTLFILYITVALEFVMGTFIIVKYRSYVRRDKWLVLSMLAPFNIIALIIQGRYPHILCELFFITIELSVFVNVLLRQDESIDPVSGAKKYSSSIGVFKKLIDTEAKFNIAFIRVVNSQNIRVYLGQVYYDKFLRMTSKVIQDAGKEVGLSGDTYYLDYGLWGFLTENVDEDKIVEVASKVMDYFSKAVMLENFELHVDVKSCVTRSPEDIRDFATLIRFGNTFHNTLPDEKVVLKYRDYINDTDFIVKNHIDEIVTKAAQNKEFEVHFQPIFSTMENKFISVEALLRLKSSEYGYISPHIFIPAVEANGLIRNIGNYVIEEACRFIKNPEVIDFGISSVQINISALQYIEEDFAGKVKSIVNQYGVKPGSLCFEITESAADVDPEAVDKNVLELSRFGIKFALDSYGTGYSNTKRLIDLPVDLVKFDKVFIDSVKDKALAPLVEDSISMQKALGRQVLIQGVEDEEVARYFIDLGCDYLQGCEFIQGFYYCKALPSQELLEFFKRNVK